MNTTSHPEGQIDCTAHGAVLQISINRPAKRNGFTPKMYRELGEAYTRLDDDPALRVGVLCAAGDHFTAGLDLPTIAPLMQRGEKAVPLGLVDPLNLVMEGYRRRTKPMIAAIRQKALALLKTQARMPTIIFCCYRLSPCVSSR